MNELELKQEWARKYLGEIRVDELHLKEKLTKGLISEDDYLEGIRDLQEEKNRLLDIINRESDGNQRGRPNSPHSGKNTMLYLDNATIVNAKEIGSGNTSKGVRLAVEAYNFLISNPTEKITFSDLSRYVIKHIEKRI